MHKFSGASYIGSTSRTLRERMNEHIEDLEKGCHHSPYLQNSYNKFPYAFKFEVLEVVDANCGVSDLVLLEQSYIDKLKPKYNGTQQADYRKGKPPAKKRGRPKGSKNKPKSKE